MSGIWDTLGGSEPAESGSGSAAATPECPNCGTPDVHGDDFCHECGHAYAYSHRDADAEADDDVQGETCPSCLYGEIIELSYGVRQCESCGYTARDWSTA